MRFLIFIVVIISLGSCSNLQHSLTHKKTSSSAENLKQWRISGRISIKTPEETNIVNIRWLQKNKQIQLRLYGSMGKTYARLISKDGLSTLTVDKKTYTDTDPRYLFWTVLGWDLPINEMIYWIKGITHPASLEQQLIRDKNGQIASFNYKDWHVEYGQYRQFDKLKLPVKIILTHPQLRIRFSIQNWQTSEKI